MRRISWIFAVKDLQSIVKMRIFKLLDLGGRKYMKEIHELKPTSGQALPIVILFMGLIIGAAAVTIDYGKVSALRNQAQSASSAAALAAAQVIANEINADLSSSNTSVTINLANAENTAKAIYAENMNTAIAHSSSLNSCYVSISLTPEKSSGKDKNQEKKDKNQDSGDDNQNSQQLTVYLDSPIYVQVSSSGTTPLNWGSLLGIPTAQITPKAMAEASIGSSVLVPLLLPDWQNYWFKGSQYAVYRGSGDSSAKPSWTQTENISPCHIIAYHKQNQNNGDSSTSGCNNSVFYGNGEFGWIKTDNQSSKANNNNLYVGDVVKFSTGTEQWKQELDPKKTIRPLSPGQVVILPVAYPYSDKEKQDNGNASSDKTDNKDKSAQIYGFITATINYINPPAAAGKDGSDNQSETDIGFSFTVDQVDSSNSTSPFFTTLYSVHLVPNSSS
ncbi:pilus assembly protein TadG-related protein [Sulfobacillus thermosulfidooxidans]|uniref:pilus assembly protein TadG-related protein n=1 Tax=Sulfobacillus thermosulfidooxidans TaxID=28034 RepID=UPI001FA7ADF4|nr:pilus assembly protein TadG-related protein [Sulfobacillus thermosulfidooxidans]